MNDRTKKEQEEQKQQLKQAIANLALQLELQEGRRFNINHGSAEGVFHQARNLFRDHRRR